ncbi:glycosyltransferase family 2 protein [Knoellia sp. LjRoot47]|uniref:glycosyltransferase family 2 protein n=1 Tax=Knoellia sp. LjRoot47 TaxID=3342330 RepID=UPI003ECD6B4F
MNQPPVPGRLPIVVAIPTKDEAANIELTVASVRDRFEAVVVVDSMSSDETVALARAAGADVVEYRWDGGYPKKKQWCLENVRTDIDWLLFLDGDETPSEELLAELDHVFARTPDCAAYDIPLRYSFAGQTLEHGYTVVKRSLLDRTRCHYPAVDDLEAPGMGEQEGHYQPDAPSSRRLGGTILHEDLDPLNTWFARHNRYSDWEAWLEENPRVRAQVVGLKTRQGRLFQRMPGKPLAFFLYTYLLRGGFRDGSAGLDYALALSFYRWQVAAKVRESQRLASRTSTSERTHVS